MEGCFFSHTGKYHIEHNMPNEDCVVILKNDDLAVSVIADGAGVKKAGKEAARLIVPAIAEWIYDAFLELYYRNGEYVRREAVRIINICLKSYAKSNGIEENDLACTLMAAAMDSDGRCLCIHMGDGVILRRMEGYDIKQAEVISPPENGLTSKTTYLTMNCNMWGHIRYCRWNDPETECIISLTDGAQTHIADLENAEGWSVTASCQLDARNVVNHLMCQHPVDDYSFAIISK